MEGRMKTKDIPTYIRFYFSWYDIVKRLKSLDVDWSKIKLTYSYDSNVRKEEVNYECN